MWDVSIFGTTGAACSRSHSCPVATSIETDRCVRHILSRLLPVHDQLGLFSTFASRVFKKQALTRPDVWHGPEVLQTQLHVRECSRQAQRARIVSCPVMIECQLVGILIFPSGLQCALHRPLEVRIRCTNEACRCWQHTIHSLLFLERLRSEQLCPYRTKCSAYLNDCTSGLRGNSFDTCTAAFTQTGELCVAESESFSVLCRPACDHNIVTQSFSMHFLNWRRQSSDKT